MRKTLLISFITLLVFLECVPVEAGPARQDRSRRKVLIGFKESAERQTTESRRSFIRGQGGRTRRDYRHLSAVAAELSDSQISRLRANPRIAYVEEDGLLYTLDVEFDASWGVKRISAGEIHALSNKGAGVKVALIDTGIDLDHPDLVVAGNVTFVDDTADGDDDRGHGTHCAGIIAALDNEIGVVGIAPEASIYAVKVMDSTGSGYLSDVVAGIDWAIDNGMNIISMSMGTNFDYQTLREACDRANAAGIVVVAAAGNDYSVRRGRERDTVDYPARYDSVIAVGAIDDTDTRAYFSSTGSALELAAPGVSIYSTTMGGTYATMSGTSMACPHVAGVAALILSGPGGDVCTVLQETADDLGDAGWDQWYGHGLVNAAEAAKTAPQPPVLATIQVFPNNVMLYVGEKQQFALIGTDQYGNPIATGEMSWESDDPTVGTVDNNGLFIADGAGEVTITATGNGGVSGTASVLVIEVPILDQIEVQPDNVTLYVGQTQKFAATGIDQYGDPIATGNVTWESDNPDAGTVDGNGLFTAIGVGVATITATGDGSVIGTALVTVQAEPVGPEEFTFTGNVAPREEFRHTVSISGSATLHANLTWSGWGDLRLRIYDPDGTMVAEADSSTWQNREEEIVIDVGPGNWQIAVQSDSRRQFIYYAIEGTVSY